MIRFDLNSKKIMKQNFKETTPLPHRKKIGERYPIFDDGISLMITLISPNINVLRGTHQTFLSDRCVY